MEMKPEEREVLREALRELARGEDALFEDRLWLGFGDGWRPMLRVLERRGYIRIGGPDRSTPSLTSRGQNLMRHLEDTPAARAG